MDLDAYFARVGFNGARAPTLDALRDLHLAHAQTIAFENLNPLLGWRVPLDLPSLEQKLVHSGRGGYCFEQNALLATALRELGFSVTGLAARVLWNAPEDAIRPRSHMLLKIDLAGELYLADVGFGGLTQTGPLRLVTDIEQVTPHERFRLVRIDVAGGSAGARAGGAAGNVDARTGGADLKMQALIGDAWKTLYRFDLQPQFDVDYEVANHYMATYPTSHFRSMLIAARPVPGGRYALSNNQLAIHRLGAPSERRVLANVQEVRQVLESMFGLTLPAAPELDPALARACGFPA
jgi:N-hydroxyarylamine O-acetyltransferase